MRSRVPQRQGAPCARRDYRHFTPTSSSWLNLVEGWFFILTRRRQKKRVFSSVPQIEEAIEIWADHWNDDPTDDVWKKPVEETTAKVKRGRARLASAKSETDR